MKGKKRTAMIAIIAALALSVGFATGGGIRNTAKAAEGDYTVTIDMNGGEYATDAYLYKYEDNADRDNDAYRLVTKANTYSDVAFDVTVTSGAVLTHDYVQNTLFVDKIPFYKTTDGTHQQPTAGADLTSRNYDESVDTRWWHTSPDSGGYINKAADGIANDEVTGAVYAVPMLQGLFYDANGNGTADAGEPTFRSGDALTLTNNMAKDGKVALKCFYTDGKVQYGNAFVAGEEGFRPTEVSIRKAWSPAEMPVGRDETKTYAYTAEYLQLFYHEVKAVGRLAFNNNADDAKAVTYVQLPDTVTDLCESAFKGCEGLTYFEGRGVQKIFKNAFYRVNVQHFLFGGALEEIRPDFVFKTWKSPAALIFDGENVTSNFRIENGPGAWFGGEFELTSGAGLMYAPVGQGEKLMNGQWNNLRNYYMGADSTNNFNNVDFQISVREMYRVHFDLNGGTGYLPTQYQDAGGVDYTRTYEDNAETADVDESFTFNNITEHNPVAQDITKLNVTKPDMTGIANGTMTFMGWSLMADGDVLPDTFFGPEGTKLTKDTTLYAIWADSVSVTFDSDGGSDVDTAYVLPNTTVTAPEDPTKLGYVFAGWYTADEQAWNFEEDVVTANMTLTAHWTAQTYTVTYNGGKDATVPDDAKTTYTIEDNTFALPVATREGYTFDGWFDNSAMAGTAVTEIAKGSTGNKEFFAKWSVTEYTITYNVNGGEMPAEYESKYTVADAVTLAVPTKAGYTFVGWCAQEDLSDEAVKSIAKGTTGNKTFYAKWTATEYTITYNANGGTVPTDAVKKFTVESDAVTLDTPTREGYTFGGWYASAEFTGEAVTSVAAGTTGNKTFFAKWTANTTPDPDPEPDPDPGKDDGKKGCGGFAEGAGFAGVAAGILLLAGGFVLLRRKRDCK